jgi:protein SCO1/2
MNLNGMTQQISKNLYLLLICVILLLSSSPIKAAAVFLSRPILLNAETLSDLKSVQSTKEGNRWQMVVFGFSHCKDICPMSLANLSMLVKAAANERINLYGIFVTVDPDRDSEEILSSYTQSFGSNIGYLRFEGEKLERFKATFGVEASFYTRNAGNLRNYQVDHSTSGFLIDPNGKIRVIFDALEDITKVEKIFRENKELFKL